MPNKIKKYMDISGTLHFYSGADKELFFVFDDDIAQELYTHSDFDLEDIYTRRAYISVGEQRFIHRRTLSFSRKQTEVKVSLCSKATKDDLGALTTLYDWFESSGTPRPPPLALIGKFRKVRHNTESVWELILTEPTDLVVPPGLSRRTKSPPSERASYKHRRLIVQPDLGKIGRVAEVLALELAKIDFPAPAYSCLWRDKYLDSERIEIRKMGIIADIDVWDEQTAQPQSFLEIKAQKVNSHKTEPFFFLSASEWRSCQEAKQSNLPYVIWLFQYKDIAHFTNDRSQLSLVVFEDVHEDWLESPDNFLVSPGIGNGTRYVVA